MSPASGNFPRSYARDYKETYCFHSINVPSEWEHQQLICSLIWLFCFHSINVPSEWELYLWIESKILDRDVSIQLMSPASGNCLCEYNTAEHISGFHSINVPSEWEQYIIQLLDAEAKLEGFHSINVPSEWEHEALVGNCIFVYTEQVSIQLMSPASGNAS